MPDHLFVARRAMQRERERERGVTARRVLHYRTDNYKAISSCSQHGGKQAKGGDAYSPTIIKSFPSVLSLCSPVSLMLFGRCPSLADSSNSPDTTVCLSEFHCQFLCLNLTVNGKLTAFIQRFSNKWPLKALYNNA